MFERRGVSESLGFILVFGIIVSITSLVYVTGFSDLQGTRDFEQGNNAERAFNVLRANVQDVTRRGAPSRGTEVKLADAELYTDDPVPMWVVIAESGNRSNNETLAVDISPIVYETDDSMVVYSNGATFRGSRGGVAMVEEPGVVVSSDRVVLPVIHTYPAGGTQSTGGSRTVLVRTLNAHDDGIPDVIGTPDVDTFNVTVYMNTTRAEQWERFFRSEGFTCDVAGDSLQCWKDGVEHVRVTRTRVKVIFE